MCRSGRARKHLEEVQAFDPSAGFVMRHLQLNRTFDAPTFVACDAHGDRFLVQSDCAAVSAESRQRQACALFPLWLSRLRVSSSLRLWPRSGASDGHGGKVRVGSSKGGIQLVGTVVLRQPQLSDALAPLITAFLMHDPPQAAR
eukprot:5227269-Prymnesium_polylepis.1